MVEINLQLTANRIILISAILIISGLIACSDDNPKMGETAETPTNFGQADQVTSQAHIYLYSGSRKTTDLRADELHQFSKLDSTVAYNLDVDFFDSTGQIVSNLVAREGYIREQDNFLAVSGSVVVRSRDSARLNTEYLEWDAGRELVSTDSFVTITYADGSVTNSLGMESDPQFKDIRLKKRVSGRVQDVEKLKDE